MNKKNLISEIRTQILYIPIYIAAIFLSLFCMVFGDSLLITIIEALIILTSIVTIILSINKLNQSVWESFNLFLGMTILGVNAIFIANITGIFSLRMIIVLLLLEVIAIIIGFCTEGKHWNKKLEIWQEKGKIDFRNAIINVLEPWYIPKDNDQNVNKSYLAYIFIGMSGIVIKLITRSGTEFFGFGYFAAISSVIIFYVVGISLKRLKWIISYQNQKGVIFYNELGN